MKPTRLAWIVIGLAAVAGAWFAGRQEGMASRTVPANSQGRAPGTQDAGGGITPAEGLPVARRGRPPAQLAAQPRILLPPLDAPLSRYMPALTRAARRGDVGAMCRLSFEFQRCSVQLRRLRRSVEDFTDDLAAEPNNNQDQSVKYLAKKIQERDELERVCEGVDVPADMPPWRLLRDAARLGHVPSMRRFAMAPPFDRNRYLDDFSHLASFRDEAAGFLVQAAERGDAQAAAALVSVYDGANYGLIASRIPENRAMALAYLVALRGLGDAKVQENLRKSELRIRRSLSPQERAESERLGREMAPRYADAREKPFGLEPFQPQTAEECSQ